MFKTRLKFIIQPAEINDAAILADVHKENFFPSWGKEVFANFLQQAQFVTFIAVLSASTSCSENHKIIGFLVARQVGVESEHHWKSLLNLCCIVFDKLSISNNGFI